MNKRRKTIQPGSSLNFNKGYRKVSINKNKDIAKKRNKKHNNKRRLIMLEAAIFSALLVIVMILGLRVSDTAVVNIDKASFSQQAAAEVELDIKQVVSAKLNESFKNRIKLGVPRQELEAAVKAIPEVKDAGLTISRSGSKPIINVVLEDVVAVYRRAGSNYLLTEEGRVVSSANTSVVTDLLPVINDKLFNIDNVELTQGVISARDTRAVVDINTILSGQGDFLEVNEFELNENPGEIIAVTTGGVKIKFFSGEEVSGQAATLIAFTQSIDAEIKKTITYIDSRTTGRIVYK